MSNIFQEKSQFEKEAYDYYKSNIGPIQKMQNNDVDAFLHAYVSGRFTMKYGAEISNILGIANEIVGFRNSTAQRNMDLWNNSIGRKYGTQSSSNDDLAKSIKNALDDNELITTIDPNSDSRQYNNQPTNISFVDDGSSFSIFSGNITPFLSNGIFYVDENGKEVSFDKVAQKTPIPNSNPSESPSFITIVKTNFFAVVDGAKVAITDLITQTISTTQHLASFIGHQLEFAFSPIFNTLFSNEDASKDSTNQTSSQRLAGSILADLVLGKDITEIANSYINQTLITSLLQDASNNITKALPLKFKDVELDQFIKATVSDAIIRFAIMVAADHRMDSDEYGTAAVKALSSAALIKHFITNPAEGVAAIISLYDSFKADSSMNNLSQYQDVARRSAAYIGSVKVANDNFHDSRKTNNKKIMCL